MASAATSDSFFPILAKQNKSRGLVLITRYLKLESLVTEKIAELEDETQVM